MIEPVGQRIPSSKKEIGWREIVGLPDLGIASLHAKIDTGARTSALHAVDLAVIERDGAQWAEFHVPQPGTPHWKRCATPILDVREIKNTSGVPEQRYVVGTTLILGKRHWHIEVSLADREQMEFDLILGRTAIRRRRLLVNPGRSFLVGPPVQLRKKALSTPRDGPIRTLKRRKKADMGFP